MTENRRQVSALPESTIEGSAAMDPAVPDPAVQQPRVIDPATQSNAIGDVTLIAILDAPLRQDETARTGFARKERELAAAFASLPVVDQLALAKRLAMPCTGDRLAEKFGRLTWDRRARLVQFLQDARRRAALAKGRG